jgi:hypothetical protein
MKGDKGISCRVPMKLIYIRMIKGTCSLNVIPFFGQLNLDLDL